MKVSELLANDAFDVNARARIFAKGPWNDGARQVGSFSSGTLDCPDKVKDAEITYVTVDANNEIIIECDAEIDAAGSAFTVSFKVKGRIDIDVRDVKSPAEAYERAIRKMNEKDFGPIKDVEWFHHSTTQDVHG